MRLICPNCVAQYEVDENVIPPEGRDVQCANCGHNWFQDSIQMLSTDDELPTGTGDPDSDVPPELFNDLEGKLDTEFVSSRAETAPDPNDMEPEEPRDDFQIEQQPATPSSRLDQDALDVLRAEAEYSSGEKPPALHQEPADTEPDAPLGAPSDTIPDTSADEPSKTAEPEPETDMAEDLSADSLSEAAPEPTDDAADTPSVDTPVEDMAPPAETTPHDDLDEIRRRIMDLEILEQDDTAETAPEPATAEVGETAPEKQDTQDTIIDAEVIPTPSPDGPDSKPADIASTPPDAQSPPRYEENIPLEEDITAALEEDMSVDDAIETLVSEHSGQQEVTARIRNKASPRPFPNIVANEGNQSDELYGASQDRVGARKDMFQDVDELSSEIASEAENGTYEQQTDVDTPEKPKSGFMTGFKYAIFLSILIAILYLLQPVILQYIPQSEGLLKLVTAIVNMVTGLLTPLIEMAKGLIG